MADQPDGVKWFGEGFDGFPKILLDDCVQYTVYIIDSKLNDFNVREQLRKVQAAANALCKNLLKDFIWQRDAFGLEMVQQKGQNFLQGRSNYGDSVEDEWLIVYLLRELSRQFPQCWVRVFDSDGEFLLIEAADALPRWLNPEIAENRVWINSGKLLVVPKARANGQGRLKALNVDDALAFIQTRSSDFLHVKSMESEAFYRLQKYPGQIKSSVHRAIVTIPRKLAYVLHETPAYISQAVEAFYLRDPIALRPLQARDRSRLLFPPEDFVTVSVRFTKVGYAQLKGQDYQAPVSWTAGGAKAPDMQGQTGSETGMKITCGFEMLLSDPHNVDKKSVREIKLLLEDLDAGEEQLPSDDEISRWEYTQDDESWLDINFEDFEKELSGRSDQIPLGQGAGFGDRAAQDNLRKMVARFEKFLNDDDGPAEDAEFPDDMDNDDDSNSADGTATLDGNSEQGEEGIDFDDDRFASMMSDMMGLAPSTALDTATQEAHAAHPAAVVEEDDAILDEGKEIRRVMDGMEAELRQAGALSLNPPTIDKTVSGNDSSSSPVSVSGVSTGPNSSQPR
ncbi:MAG: hypothetical protein LQ341_002578 [Variospora aurantia]|nr:MAG: hypothetical protein LQ341_002578 [Variospora aurantia]